MSLARLFACLLLVALGSPTFADEPAAAEPKAETPEAKLSPEMEANFKAFSEKMSRSTLRGHFTIDGKEGPPKEESYFITSVKKLPNEDFWLFQATVKYGDKNVTLPMPLRVKWAGNTPVITLDKVTIPTLGTFSSRVVIDGDRYAGTWTHDKVGGHLFGVIEKMPDGDAEKPAEDE